MNDSKTSGDICTETAPTDRLTPEAREALYGSGEKLTPKQRYEAQRAERDRRRQEEIDSRSAAEQKEAALLKMVDRFVAAVERIAAALEHR